MIKHDWKSKKIYKITSNQQFDVGGFKQNIFLVIFLIPKISKTNKLVKENFKTGKTLIAHFDHKQSIKGVFIFRDKCFVFEKSIVIFNTNKLEKVSIVKLPNGVSNFFCKYFHYVYFWSDGNIHAFDLNKYKFRKERCFDLKSTKPSIFEVTHLKGSYVVVFESDDPGKLELQIIFSDEVINKNHEIFFLLNEIDYEQLNEDMSFISEGEKSKINQSLQTFWKNKNSPIKSRSNISILQSNEAFIDKKTKVVKNTFQNLKIQRNISFFKKKKHLNKTILEQLKLERIILKKKIDELETNLSSGSQNLQKLKIKFESKNFEINLFYTKKISELENQKHIFVKKLSEKNANIDKLLKKIMDLQTIASENKSLKQKLKETANLKKKTIEDSKVTNFKNKKKKLTQALSILLDENKKMKQNLAKHIEKMMITQYNGVLKLFEDHKLNKK